MKSIFVFLYFHYPKLILASCYKQNLVFFLYDVLKELLYKHHYTKFKFELKQRKTKIKELCPFVYRPPKKTSFNPRKEPLNVMKNPINFYLNICT